MALGVAEAPGELDEAGLIAAAAGQALARVSFLEFVQYTKKGYVAERLHEYVAGKLEAFLGAVERGESPRLMVFMPPQEGKSELVSRRFPCWVLGQHPEWRIGIVSYGAELAEDMSQDARRVVQSEEYRRLWPEIVLDPTSKAVSDWTLDGHIGGVRAVGIGGAITGRSLEILIVDDPVKGRLEVDRDTYRKEQQAWWPQAHDRVQEGGGIILLCTRWHHDDLPGWLLRRADEEPGADQWDVIRLPALAEKDDPLGRAEGEPSAPGRHSLGWLLREKANIPERDWLAKFQQRPSSDEGSIFKSAWFRFEDDPGPPDGSVVVQVLDTAFSERTTADYTVTETWRVEPSGYRLLDVDRQRLAFPALKANTLAGALQWRPAAIIIEDAGSGKSLIQELRSETSLPVLAWRPDRDKVARAHASTPLFAARRVIFPKSAPWLSAFLSEVQAFPTGEHDDQVDPMTTLLTLVQRPPEQAGEYTVLQMRPYSVDKEMARAGGGRWAPRGYERPILA